MKKLLIIVLLGLTLQGFAQNNAPIAVNDTFEVSFNQQTIFQKPSFNLTANDIEPDGDNILPDTTFYNGSAFFQTLILSPSFWVIKYQAPANFWGIDSVRFVIKDDGAPVLYDTSTIYFFVKRLEFEHFNLNNIKARVDHRGLFQDVPNSIASFEVPKGDTTNTIFAANLWMAGKNQDSVYANSETFGAQLTYGRSGPIMDSVFYKKSYDYDWDRVWKVYESDINYHINNWSNGGYQPPQVFLDWPAHGDTAKGQAYYLAPFVDNNGDGNYNPYDGDYPKIKGQQAVYFIYNDMREKYNTRPMQTEVHGMVYGYHCPSDSAIYNTLFIDYTIYNRSSLIYDSTYIGMWTDFDIGGSTDDFVGCDVARSTFYGYNADAIDEGGNGVKGYQNNPPAQGVTFLQGAKQYNDGMDNPLTTNVAQAIAQNGIVYPELGLGFGDGITDNEYWRMEHFMYYNTGPQFPGDGFPIGDLNYYNYLQSKWGDGTHAVWGGNGNAASSGGTIPSDYLFPADSDPLFWSTDGVLATPANWSETTAGNPPGDRRGLGSTGPFTFEPDSSIEITLAFVFGRDYQNTGSTAGLVVMQERVDSIHSYYRNGFTTTACGSALSVKEVKGNDNALVVYPNPFNGQLTINYELENTQAQVKVFNAFGKLIKTTNIFQQQSMLDLSHEAKGIYFIQLIDGINVHTKKVVKQ